MFQYTHIPLIFFLTEIFDVTHGHLLQSLWNTLASVKLENICLLRKSLRPLNNNEEMVRPFLITMPKTISTLENRVLSGGGTCH